MNKLDKLVKEMLEFSNTAGIVVDCGACNNRGCKVCDNIDYDVLADEYAQQQAYESGRVFH